MTAGADRATATRPAPCGALPAGLESYRRTGDFTETTVPKALLAAHSTKAGVWGLIHVLSGQLHYRVLDERRIASARTLSPDAPPGVVEPEILHEVEPVGPVLFFVEFFR